MKIYQKIGLILFFIWTLFYSFYYKTCDDYSNLASCIKDNYISSLLSYLAWGILAVYILKRKRQVLKTKDGIIKVPLILSALIYPKWVLKYLFLSHVYWTELRLSETEISYRWYWGILWGWKTRNMHQISKVSVEWIKKTGIHINFGEDSIQLRCYARNIEETVIVLNYFSKKNIILSESAQKLLAENK